MSTFGEWLRRERSERRLTREELARRIGCSVAMLRKMEADERRPSAQIAGLLANALDIPSTEQETFVRAARGELGIDRLATLSGRLHPRGASPSAAPRNNLPVLPTPLIGRQHELIELHRLLADPECRMLTLVGPGGIGKTRLAIEAASNLQDDFGDGVYFVPLAPVDSSRFLVPVIAHSLGLSFLSADSTDPKTLLLNYVKEKQLLLLVDNIEHLLNEPGVELFVELLACAPEVKMLGTAREPLNLQYEWVFEVKGLPVPEDSIGLERMQDTSIELFLQRSRRAYVGFDATTDDYPAVRRICRLLDGTPLAIELAAVWVRTLTCEEIANEIECSLDLLKTSARDLPARHRSMRAVFDHSWDHLSDDERRALARLSVFRGGFDRDAAAQVAGAPLGMLSTLVAKSLVRRPEPGRYDLHELVRQYAAIYLSGDAAACAEARQQHFAFYLALAEAAGRQLHDSNQFEVLRRLEQEHDNFRAALAWALGEEHGGKGALQLAGALRWFWAMRGYFDEGRGWLEKALDHANHAENSREHARALEGLALLENCVGRHAIARTLAEQSAAIFRRLGDQPGLADALMIIGQALRWEGDEVLSHTRLEEALALYRELGDRWKTARSLFRLGQDLTDFGGDVPARAMLEESAAILGELGDSFILVGVLNSLALMAANQGDFETARSHFDRALILARKMSDPWGLADTLTNLGSVLRTQGDHAGARSYLEDALKVYEQSGRGTWCADPLCALAENEMAQGHLSAAREYLQDASSWAMPSANCWLHVLVGYFDGLLAYYEGNPINAAASLEETIALARASLYTPDLARSLIALARVWCSQGHSRQALVSVTEALRLYSRSCSRLGIATALEVFAGRGASENPRRAVRWLSAAHAIRSTIGAPMPPVDVPEYERNVAALRAQLGNAGFEEAWAAAAAEPFEAAVADALALSDGSN